MFLTGGIVLSRLAAFTAAEAGLCLLAFVVLAWLARVAGSPFCAPVCTWLACSAAGLLVAVRAPAPAPPAMEAGPRRLTGCVLESSAIHNGRMQFVLELLPGARARVSLPPDRQGAFPATLLYGQTVSLDLRLRPVRGFHNPGSFDTATYLARRSIYWNATAPRGSPVEIHPQACGSAWRRLLERWRAAALARIDSLYPGDTYRAAMMRGLLLGDKSGIRKAWIEDFRRTGTYHALVISGSHVTLLCGIFLFWRRFSGYGLRTVPLAASLLAWLYALLAGADPPVLRAAAGFTLFGAAAAVYRRPPLVNIVAAVAILFLLADPTQLLDASFQLSFLAVAALGAFFPQRRVSSLPDPRSMSARLELRLLGETIHHLLRLPAGPLQKGLSAAAALCAGAWRMFLVSAAVQAGLALPMALLFHRVSITGLSANVLAVPVVSLAIPAGFAAVFTGWQWMAALAGALLDVARSIASWHARFEPFWRVPDPPLWLVLAICAAFLGWTALARQTARRLCAATAAILLALLIVHPFPPEARPGELELTAIDVGQGESLLLGLPGGSFALVDGGGLPQFNRPGADPFDIGEEVVSPYLWSRGIRRLAVIAVTHLHDDHAGGVPALIANFRPREVWTGFAADHRLWRQIEQAAIQTGSRIRVLKQGDLCPLSGVACEVLAPARGQPWTGKPRNDDSLVMRLRYGRHKFLLTGDIERRVEARLVEEGLLGRIDVLKVAHHGSRLSSLPLLLDTVHPAVALISAGQGNSYGLPHPATIEALRRRFAFVLRTDTLGLVTIRSDGAHLSPGPGPSPGLWWRVSDWD